MSISRKVGLLTVLAAAAVALAYLFAPDGAAAATGMFMVANAVPALAATQASLNALLEQRGELVAKLQGILATAEEENRDLTAEEQSEYDNLMATLTPLKNRIARMEGLSAEQTALGVSRGAVASRQGPASIPRPGGPEAKKEFESFAHFMAAVRFSPNDQRLQFIEGVGAADGFSDDISAEMRMDSGPSGGFMVPKQFRGGLFAIEPQEALVRPRATVLDNSGPAPDAAVSMTALDQSGTAPGNMYGGMEFKWIAEGDEKPETDMKVGEIELAPKEVAGFITVTDKLLRNWQGSAATIEKLMRQGVNAAEDFAFLRGDGVARPLGALNAPATKYINRTTANQIKYNDLINMVARMLMRDGQPIWSAPQSALPQIAQLVDANDNLIWHADAREGFAGTLLGYPLRWNNRSPALGTKGDLLLADWSKYLIKDGSGPFVAASEHVLFKSNKTLIKIFWNVDGAPWLKGPIQEENGYEVSAFVGLDVPA